MVWKYAAIFTGLLLTSCQTPCSDLANRAFNVDLQGIDASLISFDVYAPDAASPSQTGLTLGALGGLAGGRYDVAVIYEGATVDRLEGICTPGFATGCEAEELAEHTYPTLLIRSAGDTVSAELTTQGECL